MYLEEDEKIVKMSSFRVEDSEAPLLQEGWFDITDFVLENMMVRTVHRRQNHAPGSQGREFPRMYIQGFCLVLSAAAGSNKAIAYL